MLSEQMWISFESVFLLFRKYVDYEVFSPLLIYYQMGSQQVVMVPLRSEGIPTFGKVHLGETKLLSKY